MEASVIGLGMMGTTLARLLLRAGWRVTVWNRSGGKADALVQERARLAASAADAVRASPVLVMCVSDYAAAREILHADGVATALAGRVVLQLSTGGPDDAAQAEAWARAQGAEFLAGAIQAAPSQMGLPDTPILVAGARPAFERSGPVLGVFGGGISYLGERASLSPAMDLATLSYVYGTIAGFFQGALIAEKAGLGVDVFGNLVEKIAPSFGAFLKHEGQVIHSGNFTASESPLRISVEATERIARYARDAQLHSGLADLAASLFRQAADAGLADEEAAAVIKVMRR